MSMGLLSNVQRQFWLPLTVSVLLFVRPQAVLAAGSASAASAALPSCTVAAVQALVPTGASIGAITDLNPNVTSVPTGREWTLRSAAMQRATVQGQRSSDAAGTPIQFREG